MEKAHELASLCPTERCTEAQRGTNELYAESLYSTDCCRTSDAEPFGNVHIRYLIAEPFQYLPLVGGDSVLQRCHEALKHGRAPAAPSRDHVRRAASAPTRDSSRQSRGILKTALARLEARRACAFDTSLRAFDVPALAVGTLRRRTPSTLAAHPSCLDRASAPRHKAIPQPNYFARRPECATSGYNESPLARSAPCGPPSAFSNREAQLSL